MNAVRADARHAGVTLIELLVAMVVTGLVIVAGLTLMNQQVQAFMLGVGRSEAAQNYRFALNTLERELRTAGYGVLPHQPQIVYAGEDVVAFNANLVSRDPLDLGAVYVDPDAPPGSFNALGPGSRIQIPQTSTWYPDTAYTDASGVNGAAETIVFFFAADTTNTLPGRYALFRQVNAQPPEIVARNLRRTEDQPFFEYHRLLLPDTGATRLAPLAPGEVPLFHFAKVRGSAADTAGSARIDSIRAVRVRFTATSSRDRPIDHARGVTRLIRLANMGVTPRVTCGDVPQFGAAVTGTQVEDRVALSWAPAIDEYGGEQDVLRYLIWRRTSPADEWGDAYASVPAGRASYSFSDRAVVVGTTYYYAVAAQDCSPALSTQALAAPITVQPYP